MAVVSDTFYRSFFL